MANPNPGCMRNLENCAQMGLPFTTTATEPTIKQINRRMKETENYWDEGAQAQLSTMRRQDQ
jgi:hypothetical protein